MQFSNPYALRKEVTPRELVVFAAGQRQGNENAQEDYFLNFNDECFVIADGLSVLPNGYTAAKLACETAIWGYKHIRQHKYYWLDKKLFMKRIFRSTNLAVWQKRREQGFEAGLATNLLVCMIGAKTYWIGYAGEMCAWLQSGSSIRKLTRDVSPYETEKTNALGFRRLGLVPFYITEPMKVGDVLLLTTAGCGNYLTPSDVQVGMGRMGNTIEEARAAVDSVLTSAATNGSAANETAIIIKRVATS